MPEHAEHPWPSPDRRPVHRPPLPRDLPPQAVPMRLLDVDYVHLHTSDGGDLDLTRYGTPWWQWLLPKNWRQGTWFAENRTRLEGTSNVYRVRTRPVRGRQLDLVIKFCRIGEEVPLGRKSGCKFAEAEFNSPYEEFSLVMEMRAREGTGRLLTHRPLAIYSPAEKMKAWQTGRFASRVQRKAMKYRDVELDILRQYVLIYEWVKGLSSDDAAAAWEMPQEERDRVLLDLTDRVERDLKERGFRVIDHKPTHVIVRPKPDGSLLQYRDGKPAYALVDFELLMRLPEYEQAVSRSRRAKYLERISHRVPSPVSSEWPEQLHPVNILAVDYVAGPAESTHGDLWVVGNEPELFDYFQPERWRRTPRRRISVSNETYATCTKDRINLVWKVSRMGEVPDPGQPYAESIRQYGYNSPFEEFALALELERKGFPVTSPRAIYRAGLELPRSAEYVDDPDRYERFRTLLGLDGKPVLRPDHNYLTLWGYWKADPDTGQIADSLNLGDAVRKGLLTEAAARTLLARKTHGFSPEGP